MKVKFQLLLYICLALLPLCVAASNPYEDYIARYSSLAVEHQSEYGIPASITLAQGLLESAAGRSTLASEGNNHFGIKCHKEWKGGKMLRNDDAPDECFRVYNTPEESFHDHSLFLRRTRYLKLFDLDVTDYHSWARVLRECGYATDPQLCRTPYHDHRALFPLQLRHRGRSHGRGDCRLHTGGSCEQPSREAFARPALCGGHTRRHIRLHRQGV